MTSFKKKVFRMYESRAVFESETGNCVVITQLKDGMRDCKICDRSALVESDYGPIIQVMPIEAIYGIYDLLSGPYVALIVESTPFFSSGSINIRKVKNILVVPLFRANRPLSDSRQNEDDQYLRLLHLSLSLHTFYFSFTYDITLTQQKQAQLTLKQEKEPLWLKTDDHFFWNRDAVTELIACNANEWIIPFMSAYIEEKLGCVIDNDTFTMLFVSRRSRHRQGCRFTKRGIDECGYVANFVETEQILIHKDGMISSYVQIRGSIPVQWSSTVSMKYDPVVRMSDNIQNRIDYAEKHVNDILNRYSDNSNSSGIVFINLVDNKKDQGKLGAIFKETVDMVQKRQPSKQLHYVWFDFHHETKQKGKWKNLSKLIDSCGIDDKFQTQGYFMKSPLGIVLKWQVGVIRTNCMDNLDRTNVVQSIFARRSLLMQLGKTHLLKADGTNDVLNSPYSSFEKIYKSVWASNADAISMMYAGTGALKVDFTKTGKRTIKGMINDGVNSMKRYYINNFSDGLKQDAIDIMMRKYVPDITSASSPFTPRIGQESLANNAIKSFVLLMIVFSTLLLVTPYINVYMMKNPDVLNNYEHLDILRMNLLLSIGVTSMLVMYVLYVVVKKGSKIGEKMVLHPCLSRIDNFDK